MTCDSDGDGMELTTKAENKYHSGEDDNVYTRNEQWEDGQKKRRPSASFHGPYQPL